jgi:hypothetical protein
MAQPPYEFPLPFPLPIPLVDSLDNSPFPPTYLESLLFAWCNPRSPWSQVACKLTSPSPFPPHSNFPTPHGFPKSIVCHSKTTSQHRLHIVWNTPLVMSSSLSHLSLLRLLCPHACGVLYLYFPSSQLSTSRTPQTSSVRPQIHPLNCPLAAPAAKRHALRFPTPPLGLLSSSV